METPYRFVKPSRYDRSTFIGKLNINYIFRLFWRGIRNNGLRIEDIDRCPKQEEVEANVKRLAKNWNQDKRGKNPRFWLTLTKTFGFDFIGSILLLMVNELILRIFEPLCLGVIIRYFSDDSEIDFQYACYAAYGVFLSSLLGNWFYLPSFVISSSIGMRLRVASSSLMYQKALRLSQASFGMTAVGQMVNIMSNDVNRFDDFGAYFPNMLVAPIQTVIVLYIVWTYLGLYSLVGVGLLLISLILQFWMGKLSFLFRKKTAPLTDTRLRFMHEIISGMRVIKMYCWEKPFADKIAQARRSEVKQIRNASYVKAANMTFYFVATRIIVFGSFVGYVLSGGTLTAEAVFVSLALFNRLRNTISSTLQRGLNATSELAVTCRRIQDFLLLEEFESTKPEENGHVNSMVDSKYPDTIPAEKVNGKSSTRRCGGRTKPCRMIVEKICAKWSPDLSQPTLKDVSLNLEPGDLLAVIGPVGSGKSSLLMTLLGELPITSGAISQEGVLSYAGQDCWSFNDTVRNNILFGMDFDQKRYQKVIEACSLNKDLKLMPFGDQTLVGEKGVSLSGGQKARINLARAVYRNAGIYLLDDPLSAVDAAVAEHIFEKCIVGLLKSKTRILVTHQIQFIQKATKILVLKDGQTVAYGSFSELKNKGIDFMSLLTTANDKLLETGNLSESRLRNASILSLSLNTTFDDEKPVKVIDEQLQSGSIDGKVYLQYLLAGGSFCLFCVVCVFTILSQTLLHGSDFYLSYWTNQNQLVEERQIEPETGIYIYVGLIVALLLTSVIRCTSIYSVCMRASETLHNQIFERLLRTPVSFFDTNPAGRILNRFSKDMGIVDDLLPLSINDLNARISQVLGILVIVCMVNWYMIAPSLLLILAIIVIRQFYIVSARDIKRFEGIARSPVFSHLNTTINGLATIRAYGAQQTFERQFNVYLDDHSATWFVYLSAMRALSLIIGWCCLIYVTIVTFAAMLIGGLPGGTVGLVISSALGISQDAQWVARQSAEFESQMTSVERIVEYKSLDMEAEAESSEDRKPAEKWPTKGEIQFEDMSLVYGDIDQKPVLRNLKCRIGGGEKIGIVGRTGAGKSSMIAALFRLTEPRGVIRIDGVDIQSIGLDDLRQKISIIPQDPVIYSGTIRYNLDPFDQYTDAEIWSALDQVQLKSSVNNFAEKLEAQLSESGGNLSVGQRQLICLARAILRRNRILVLDEATANIDHQTDTLIQETVRTQFVHCTVLTIAHRLNTIIDSDRVLVLDAGEIVEFDVPYVLLERKGSFYDMCQKTGPKMYGHLLQIAKSTHQSHNSSSPLSECHSPKHIIA